MDFLFKNNYFQMLFKFVFIILLCLLNINVIHGRLFSSVNLPFWQILGTSKSAGEPLMLTPLIMHGNMDQARKMARVDEQYFLNVTSYAGYLTVNEKHHSNLWFWFFPADGTEHLYDDDVDFDENYYSDTNKGNNRRGKPDWANENRPLVLWLQGGPGSSSLFGLFTEIGPFFIGDDEISLKPNNYSWHKKYSLLFIDNPVGSGFSTTDADGYTKNVTQSSEHLYTALLQFFTIFPWLQNVPFFIAGESYAGKYIPAIGYLIHQKNKISHLKINLQGLALGNALSDPINMMDYSSFAYQTGLVDDSGWREMKVFELLTTEYIAKPNGKVYWDSIMRTFLDRSFYRNFYNILQTEKLILDTYLKFMNQPQIRKAVHVGNTEFSPPHHVYFNMAGDFLNSVMHLTEYLLEEGCRIMYYSGNLDFIVAYPLSENAFKHMKWSKLEGYRQTLRKAFIVNDTLAGYTKKYENFIDAVILNAGHMVPTDQPVATLKLIDLFINDKL